MTSATQPWQQRSTFPLLPILYRLIFVYGVMLNITQGNRSRQQFSNMYKQKNSDPISHIICLYFLLYLRSMLSMLYFIECRCRYTVTNNQLDMRYRFLYLLTLPYVLQSETFLADERTHPSPNVRHEKVLRRFEKKKERRHEKKQIIHLFIHFLSLVNDLQKSGRLFNWKKVNALRSHWGSAERPGGPSKKNQWYKRLGGW